MSDFYENAEKAMPGMITNTTTLLQYSKTQLEMFLPIEISVIMARDAIGMINKSDENGMFSHLFLNYTAREINAIVPLKE